MMPGYWLSEPIQKRERNNLNSVGFAGWPEPNANCKSCLYFWTSQDKESTLCLREAVEVALTRPEIDTLLIEDSKSLGSAEEGDYIRKLFLQDRDWKAEVRFRGETDIPLSLEILALFKPVRHLALNKMDRRWLPLLNSFPNLVELDLTKANSMRPSNFISFCEYDGLVKKTPHVNIRLTDQDHATVRFPAAAKNHWRSLFCRLDGYSARLFLDLSRQVPQLNELKQFNLSFGTLAEDVDYSEAIRTLSAWIASPSCGLTHLRIASVRQYELSLPSSLTIIQGIGQNCSIQELEIGGLSFDLNWSTNVLPEIAKSFVHHLVILGECPCHNQTLKPKMLREWMLQMRPTRLISILREPYHNITFDMVDAESERHIRWKKIWQSTHQSGQTTGSPNCSFLTTMPPRYWARALERFDIRYYKHRRGSSVSDETLDMTFFVLQHWLPSISVLPCPVSRKRRASDGEEQYSSGKNYKSSP